MTGSDERPAVDLEEVRRLVDALERDLERVRDSRDVATLRAEVEQLRAALHASEPHGGVHRGLHSIRDLLARTGDELLDDAWKVGDYAGRIGRMLGM